MQFRTATPDDIPGIQKVRNAVKENVLSDPALIPDTMVAEFITQRGKGWVCESEGKVVGFSIVDMQENNIWALFVDPEWEGKGIGRQLHHLMLEWYFSQTSTTVWLGTTPHTRAEAFYRKMGWQEDGMHGSAEIKFVMHCSR